MSKDSNFTGQPVYNQVLNLLDREKIMRQRTKQRWQVYASLKVVKQVSSPSK